MKSVRIHTRTDSTGMAHLHLPLAQPNSEVDVEVVVRRVEPSKEELPSTACDRRFFATILGDRVYSRRRRTG